MSKWPNITEKSKPCYLFDLDGTLADVSHRLHHIARPEGDDRPKDWDAFFDACEKDAPIPHIVDLCRKLSNHFPIVVVSGRSDRVRHATETWLRLHNVFCDALYMRSAGDHRPDHATKKSLLKQILAAGYDPIMAFDDRDQVVKMWRDQGIPCAQVAEGNF